MEAGWSQELLGWMSAHPVWAIIVVFVIAFVESLALVGILVPGIVLLFGIGALVGLDLMPFWPAWLAASVGAFLGDIVSFGIGWRYGRHLTEIWPFSRYPGMLERGRAFFRAHGAKSVVVGRFVGPLRPVIPVSAGMLEMAPSRFLAVAIPACILWAPTYLVPGMLFGASLEVASEYAGRLALVIVIVALVLWATWWVIFAVYAYLAARSARILKRAIRWTRRHPVLGRVVGPLVDPSQPEVLSVTMLGLLLVLAFWGMLALLFLSPFGGEPRALDQAVQAQALALRNHIADPAMVAIAQLSSWWVLLPAAAALLLWLLGARRENAALHWLVAMGGGMALQLMLGWTLRQTPGMGEVEMAVVHSPSAALTLATVVLGFFAVMTAKELRRRRRKWPYLVAALLLSALTLARLYLGLDWFSGALMGLVLGLAWTAIVGIAYRQRAFRPFSGAQAGAIFFGTLALTLAWQVQDRLEADLRDLAIPIPRQALDAGAWWDEGWRTLPQERARSRRSEVTAFNLQTDLTTAELDARLTAAGWRRADPADWQWPLQALNPEPDASSLPLLGKDHLGHPDMLRFQRVEAGGQRQLTLRFWASGAHLDGPGRQVLLGQLAEERLVQRLGLISYWRAVPAPEGALGELARSLSGTQARRTETGVLLVRAAEGGDGKAGL